jgi:leucyl/phenylalanyl-tRNA--protein transferase
VNDLLALALRSLRQTASAALTLFGRRPGPFPVILTPGCPAVFPDPATAPADAPLAAGGDLSPQRLLAAYRAGIFPWYDDSTPILWWSPDPRAIFELDGLHVSRRLARTVRSGRFAVRFDTAFDAVIAGCADRDEGTWITDEMRAAYGELHRLGHAHSAEAWHDGRLAGGIYGVTVGGLFAGESMFTRIRDASKVALVALVEHLRAGGYVLFDVQFLTDHTERLGAVEVPRREYLDRLARAIELDVQFSDESLRH